MCCAVQEALGAEGTFVAINNRISQSVPHLHVHIVPRRKGDGLARFLLAADEISRRTPRRKPCAFLCRRAVNRCKTSFFE